MRQGYIDSQGNKYILTGVKAQFPRWTYAEWQAEGEPDIPWIRTDAPSGYRKVSASDTSYDNTTSGLTADDVQGAIDELVTSNPNGLNANIVMVKSTSLSKTSSTRITVNDISKYKLLRFFTSYFATTQTGPDYGGEVISVEQFKLYTIEFLRVSKWDGSYSFAARYVSDTQMDIYFPNGTQSDNACLIVVGIL